MISIPLYITILFLPALYPTITTLIIAALVAGGALLSGHRGWRIFLFALAALITALMLAGIVMMR